MSSYSITLLAGDGIGPEITAVAKDLLERVLGAATYDIGFQTVEYVASALVDLSFHDGPPPADPMQKQTEVLEALGMPRATGRRVSMTARGRV